MLFQPSNIYPSTFSGIGAGTVDVTQGINVSWQVNGDTPMTAYQIKIYQNDSGSTLMYDSGSVSVSPVFEPHDKNGNATYFTAIISAAALSTAGIVNGYQYGYKMLITQWWGVSDYVEQTSASVFITRSTPTLAINTITTPVASNSLTITANYSQAQGDPISTVEWVFALAGSESTPIRETGAISTQVLSFDADGLITGNTYSIMCKVVTSTGMEASTGFVQFPVSYSSSSLGINYQLAQLKNSSAVYLSWDDLGSNILAYPYTDTTKTTNGITFTVNGEGDVVATGTASADAYFTIAQGTLSQLGITAGQKFIVTSGYSGAKIVVTETNSSNVVVSTIEGSDPLQYIATSTTNTLKFSIVIPSGSVLSSGQQLKPMIALEDKIVAFNDVSANIEPIQDLHGYANPWPAGGGKNKCDYLNSDNLFIATSATARVKTSNIGTISISGNDVTLTRTAEAAGLCVVFMGLAANTEYCFSEVYNNRVSYYYYGKITWIDDTSYTSERIGSGSHTFTTTDAGDYEVLIWKTGKGAIDIQDAQLELGTTTPTTFAPYSNICPISGRTGLSVYRTGKNLLNPHLYAGIAYNPTVGTNVTLTDAPQQFTDNGNGVFTIVTTSTWREYSIVVPLVDGNDYHLKFQFSSNGQGGTTRGYLDLDYKILEKTNSTDANQSYDYNMGPPAGAAYYYIVITNRGTASATLTITRPQIEIGSAATAYEPYTGNTYAVDWTTEAGTVYGGTLDVVSGVLTATYKKISLGDYNYGKSADNNFYISSVTDFKFYGTGTTRYGVGLCDSFDFLTGNWASQNSTCTCYYNSGYNGYRIFFHSEEHANDSIAEFKAYMQSIGASFVYELSAPLTYQLTATQVAVLTGTNNVWSTGDSVSVTYTKDTGSQATLSGAIVTFSDSNAVLIPTPQYIPGITGISIYRYLQGESALQHVYDLATGATSILDYYAPSQMQVSYLIVAHSGIGDLFLQTTKFTPTFWFFSILLCDTDSNGDYHVSKEYIFKYGVETGAVSNNNDPTIQNNFTPYPNRQPISSLYKTGKLTSYIGKTNSQNQYSDSVSLQNAIYDISTSPLTKFLKTRKGDILMIDTAAAIQMKTEDATTQQALRATVDWVEVGDASNKSIVSVPTDSFWPIS